LPSLAKGEFALVEQSIRSAWDKPAQPIRNGTMAHDHHLYMLLAEAATQRGDESALREFAPRLEELAVRDGHRLYLAIAQRAWGVAHQLAGEYAEAESCLNQAIQLFREYSTRWQLGRTFYELGELGVAKADQEMARKGYTQALEEFEDMRALPDVERTRAALGSG
jgi:tetratricopeptide (TPR) repeat protein